MKKVQIRSFFWSIFSCIWIEYTKILTRKTPYLDTFHATENMRNEWNICQYCKRQKQPQEVFYKKKEALVQVFFCEFWKISKNIFFTEHIWATASALFNLPELKIYTKNKHVKVSEIPNFQNTYVLTIKNM